MKIIVLSDNNAKKGFQSEHGLSFFIDNKGTTLLFDTGASDIFLKNAQKLGLDIDNVDTIVLSHGHFDHGDGLRQLHNKTLICHPECFIDRYSKENLSDIGLYLSKEKIKRKYNLIVTRKPYNLGNGITFLGEIPRLNDFESQSTTFIKEYEIEDFIMDDSGLAIETEKGLVVVSGCAHAGICNIIEHAIYVTGITNVYGVIGGFHLKNTDEQTEETIQYFKYKKIKKIFPSHCISEPALSRFYEEFGFNEVKAGMVIIFQ